MKSDIYNINDQSFENFIRHYMLENGKTDSTIQKTLDMNAEYLFNQNVSSQINLSKEQELISRLNSAFNLGKGISGILLNTIVLFSIITVGVVIYNITNKYSTPLSPKHTNQTSYINKKPIEDSTVIDKTENKNLNEPLIFIEDTYKAIVDTFSNPMKKKTKKEEQDDIYRSGIYYPNQLHHDFYYDLYPAPEQIFDAKPSPENYQLKMDSFLFNEYLGEHIRLENSAIYTHYYIGQPFRKGLDDMIYVNNGEYLQELYNKQPSSRRVRTYVFDRGSNKLFPFALRNFVNINEITFDSFLIYVDKIPKKAIDKAIIPYYFRKFEVTNKEYKEFLNWVNSSNGYRDIIVSITKIDTIGFDTVNARVYSNKGFKIKNRVEPKIRRTGQILVDYNKVYKYRFFNLDNKLLKNLGSNSITVFPDTTCWIKDFKYSFNDPLTYFYCWHPGYNDYPVVGINFWQALAFLDWKTHFHQKQLDEMGIPFEIEYTLPSDIEWEIVASAELEDKKLTFMNEYTRDDSWITDLAFKHGKHGRKDLTKVLLVKDNFFKGNYIIDGGFYPLKADLLKVKWVKNCSPGSMHLDPIGVSHMDGNVSEWMLENYQDNWSPIFNKYLEFLDNKKTEDAKLTKAILEYFDSGNDENGQLVRGGNWYDERFSNKSDKNVAGINAKRFLDPNKQHSTLGFRYVIHVRRKDEKEIVEKLELLGGISFNKFNPTDLEENFVKIKNNLYASKTELTNIEYKIFLNQLIENKDINKLGKCKVHNERWLRKPMISFYFKNHTFHDYPVVNISHEAVQMYCEWLTNKYNSTIGRKYQEVFFRLPTEDEWEIAAKGGKREVTYSWGGPFTRNSRGCLLASFNYRADYAMRFDREIDTTIFSKVKDSLRLYNYEDLLLGKIDNIEFQTRNMPDYLKDLKTKKRLLGHKNNYFQNDIGLYNICGNAAEMINDNKKTKGGSWLSYAYFLQLNQFEPYDGNPSPTVGCRIFMEVIKN